MKKFSISIQLLMLVFTVLLFTSGVFIIINYFSISSIAENQSYLRLESFATLISTDKNLDSGHPNRLAGMEISYVVQKEDRVITSENAFLSQDELDQIIVNVYSEADKHPNFHNYTGRGKYIRENGSKIYYICIVDQPMNSYTLVYTDTLFTKNLVRSLFFRIFAVFLGILFLALAVIYAWSTTVTHRLKMIQNHILDLPKSKYEKAYVDSADDEIGELSRSVESMRIEIGTNEQTKQEMLQNLSHDFKTPIAVIKSYAEALQDGVSGPEALDVIIEQADLLKHKVNRLLQYNSLEYLSKDKPFEDVYMQELINGIVANYKFQTDLKFTLDLEDDVIFSGYRENWTTVVDNIIDNATRYAKSEIKIVLRPNRLRIYNDGEPIDEQFLNSIFKPYEKGSKGQFGLGMSIVKKTIDFFSMDLNVQNEEYGGVSFIISKSE